MKKLWALQLGLLGLVCHGHFLVAQSPTECTAARIKNDAATVEARRQAVRFLASADRRYYPDVEKALVFALRSDSSELVRCEAAIALGQTACCTKATLAALTLAVSGEETDGNPAETSARVRSAAAGALQICMCRFQEHIRGADSTPGSNGAEAAAPRCVQPAGIQLTAFYTQQVPEESMAQVVQKAGLALAARVGTRPETHGDDTRQRRPFGILSTPPPAKAAPEPIPFDEAAVSAADYQTDGRSETASMVPPPAAAGTSQQPVTPGVSPPVFPVGRR